VGGQALKQDTIILVVTSEATWQNLDTYCLNEHFRQNRDRFDLAIVFNGTDEAALQKIKAVAPEHLLVRENLGRDPGAFDAALRALPVHEYEQTLFMHDDHWFDQPDWFDTLHALLEQRPEIDVFGNLVVASVHAPPNYEGICYSLGYHEYKLANFPYFLQGMAGLFRKNAIDTLKRLGGVPHIHRNVVEVGQVCERLLSFILLNEGHLMAQIPPGYEKYLIHHEHYKNGNSSSKPASRLSGIAKRLHRVLIRGR